MGIAISWLTPITVTPAKAGVHRAVSAGGEVDPGLRRGDGTW